MSNFIYTFQKGFNYSQDGPGNRLVYHLSGCNMFCPWCSNPEGMDLSAGKDYDLKQIVEECVSAKPLFFGGGGVTFTGGEPTMRADIAALVSYAEKMVTRLNTNGINLTPELVNELKKAGKSKLLEGKHNFTQTLESSYKTTSHRDRVQNTERPAVFPIL